MLSYINKFLCQLFNYFAQNELIRKEKKINFNKYMMTDLIIVFWFSQTGHMQRKAFLYPNNI